MRSLLFVPADSERKLARSKQSGADALILDLEDSVVPANRPAARVQARAFLDESSDAGFRRYVRINPLASEAALNDLAAVLPGKPHGILLPKCLPEDVRTLDHYLTAFEAAFGLIPGAVRIITIATETPAAIFALGRYAGVSPRLEGITWGAEDLAACLGGGSNRKFDSSYDDAYRLARALCLLAAADAGVMPIDTIYTDFKDAAGLAAPRMRRRATLRFRRQDGHSSGTTFGHQQGLLGDRGGTRLGSAGGCDIRREPRCRDSRSRRQDGR